MAFKQGREDDHTRASATLSVKGTRYYKAAELLQKGSLSLGLAIRLEHEPGNPHDKNAVVVRVEKTGAMLGHISRERAAKYVALLESGKVIEASITNITKDGADINIDVLVMYEQSDDQLAEKHNSRLWRSAFALPTEPGIYSIQHIDSGRQYVGSSKNMKNRLHSHIRDLSLGCHANHALQSNFSIFGMNCFEAKTLAIGVSLPDLPAVEAECISSLLKSGDALYNLTEDGQGKWSPVRGRSNSEPISDKVARQRAEEERRQLDERIHKKRKQVFDNFEPKLAALSSQNNFWAYFTTTFVGAIIMLGIMFQNIKDGSLFILSAVLASVVSPFIKRYCQAKAKQPERYRYLVKQRDEELAALDNEKNKPVKTVVPCPSC
ncbi:MAG: HIRAN domain-containing protein [Methylocella sp.]